jgi:hypothetical protein
MHIKHLLTLIVAVGALGASVMAQSKILTIADTTARQGDTLLIPVRIGTLVTADSVYAGQMTFTYNAGVISIFGVQTTGTLVGGASATFNSTTGSFSFATSSIITGSGVLVYLKAMVIGSPGAQTAVGFASASLNEGIPALTLVNGRVRVLAIQIVPRTPSTLVVGDSLQFGYTGDAVLPITWSTVDTAAGKVDGSGKFRARAPGQARVRVKDSRGLEDSTSLFAIYPVQARNLTVSVRDTSFRQTLYFNLPLYLSDVTGLHIVSSQLTLTYNGSILQAVDVVTAGSKTVSWAAPTFLATSGRVDIAMAGSNELAGAGILVYVRFRVQPGATGSTAITLSGTLFNENLNANTVNGTFTALAAPIIVLAPNTAVRTIGDTLRFSVTSGGTPPYQWSTLDSTIASVDNAGLLTALKHGTTTVRAMDSQGFVGTTGSVVINDFNLSLPDTSMRLTDTLDVPLLIGNVTGLGVLSYEGRIAYDSTVVRVLLLPTVGTMSSGFSVMYKDTLNTLRIAGAGTIPLTGSGVLLRIRLRSVAATTGVSSPLALVTFQFNEGIPTATTKNGSVSIVGPASVRDEVSSGIPSAFRLEQNYPNPFNPTTMIRYAIPQRSHVTLTVYNTLGQPVAELVNAEKEAGRYGVTFNANGLASGMYLYQLQAGTYVVTKKLVLLR